MTVQASITVYREEWIAAYEQSKSDLAFATTREWQSKGATAVWLVAGSGGQTAVTRGQNGEIPYNTPTSSQPSVTLVEKHAAFELTGFDIFASQGDQNKIMQNASMAVIRRDQDLTILAELANATVTYPSSGIGGTLDLSLITTVRAKLIQNFVTVDDLFFVISPMAEAYLMQTTEFISADYRNVKPLDDGPDRAFRSWAGFNWVVSPLLTGAGTTNELMYAFDRNSLGYACNVGGENLNIGYDAKQDASWSRATIFHGAKIIQNAGVVKVPHDGSAVNT